MNSQFIELGRTAYAALAQGDLARVEQAARAMAALAPHEAEGFHLLGVVAISSGHAAVARQLFDQASTLAPDRADIFLNAGLACEKLDDNPGALARFSAAVGADPDYLKGWAALARQCRLAEDFSGEQAACQAVLDRAPFALDAAERLMRLHLVAPDTQTKSERLAQVERAATKVKDAALQALPHGPGALRAALSDLMPAAADPVRTAGECLILLAEPALGTALVQAASAGSPSDPVVKVALADGLLRQGLMAEGATLYEARQHDYEHRLPEALRALPLWRGEALKGRDLLILREQGLGDELFFLSRLPAMIASAAGSRITLATNPKLVPLLARSYPDIAVMTEPEVAAEAKRFAGAMRYWQGSVLRDLPPVPDSAQAGPFLLPDADRCGAFQQSLTAQGAKRRRMGVIWRGLLGGPDRADDYILPSDLTALRGVAARTDTSFISLQYNLTAGEHAQAETALGARMIVPESLDPVDDIDGLAALIAGLDGVVTVGTMVAPLSAGLGVPVWWLQPMPAWIFLGENHNPWFPQAKVFGKRPLHPWDEAMRALADDLARFLDR